MFIGQSSVSAQVNGVQRKWFRRSMHGGPRAWCPRHEKTRVCVRLPPHPPPIAPSTHHPTRKQPPLPPRPRLSIHAPLVTTGRLSTHAPLVTVHPNTVGMAMSGGQTNCDVPPLHFHKNNDHDDHDDRMAAATVAVVGSGDAPEPTPMPSSSDGQTCAVHAATAAANSLATAPHDRCRSLLQRAPRASTPSANGAYLL